MNIKLLFLIMSACISTSSIASERVNQPTPLHWAALQGI